MVGIQNSNTLWEKDITREDIDNYRYFSNYQNAYQNLFEQKQEYLESEKILKTLSNVRKGKLDFYTLLYYYGVGKLYVFATRKQQ